MATKIPIAQKRLFSDVFVCRDCNQKVRTQAVRVIARKIKCRRCGSKIFRPIRKK
jgi:ribosomal protein L40E